jgi:glucokinase-like ROK family protein
LSQQRGNLELLKEINRSRAFEILKNARVISRPELAQRTGLSRATIALLVDKLLQMGLVHKVGLGDSTGGRPPVLIEFNPDAAFVLGARMHDSSWGIVVTNLDAHIVHRLDVPVPPGPPELAVAALQEGVAAIRAQCRGKRILPAIGLGTPGLVDMRSGVIKSAVDVGWFEVPIREMAQEALGLQVIVANRSRVGALAEFWYGAGHGIKDLIYISIGTGVAAGIVIKGRLHVGSNSSAGELGHVTVLPDGPVCLCGNRGCLQQLVSGPVIARLARQRLRTGNGSILNTLVGHHPEQITAHTVFEAARQGDELTGAVVNEATRYLGIAIANLVNLFNPELIVLGGPVGQEYRFTIDALRQQVRRRAMAYPLSAVQIVSSSLGADAGAIGAAVLVLQRADRLVFRTRPAHADGQPAGRGNPTGA